MSDNNGNGNERELPEAPATANTRVISPNGFEWQFTARDFTASGEVSKIQDLEKYWLKYGWTPVLSKSAAPAPPAANGNGDTAPTCKYHGAMKRSTKFAGWYCPSKMGDGTYCNESVKE